MAAPRTLFSIGHSTHPWDEFLALLKSHGVKILADVRTIPKSRRHPQFRQDHLAGYLPENRISYIHLPELGGLRKPRPDSPNTGWRHPAFRGYADYMESDEFAHGLDRLNDLLPQGPVAVMCAEAVPWRCHRSLISDAETARGIAVAHILSNGPAKPHLLTPFAVVVPGTDPPLLRYPPAPEPASHAAAPDAADASAKSQQGRRRSRAPQSGGLQQSLL